MRSESSALPLHHIKTTVFTVILVLPCISEPAERSGIGLCQQPFDSPLGVKKRLSYSSRFDPPVHQRACRAFGNRDDGTPSFDSESGLKKRLSSQSFWYSRASASTPSVRESGRRNAVIRFQVGITKADTNVSAFWYSRRESNP